MTHVRLLFVALLLGLVRPAAGSLDPRHFTAGADLAYQPFEFASAASRTGVLKGTVNGVLLKAQLSTLTVQLPFYSLSFENSQPKSGLGDVQLALRRGLGLGRKLSLTAGVSASLPTGNTSDGLGSGRFELIPFANLAYGLRGMVLRTSFSANFIFGGTSPLSVMTVIADPHGERELRYSLHLGRGFEGLWADVGLFGATVLTAGPGPGAGTFLCAAAEANLRLARQLSLGAAFHYPFVGDKRFNFRAILGVTYAFSS